MKTTIELSREAVHTDAWREASYIAVKAPAVKDDDNRRDRLSMIAEDRQALDLAFARAAEDVRNAAAEYIREYHFHNSPSDPVRVVMELHMPSNFPEADLRSPDQIAHQYAVLVLVAEWMRLTSQGELLKEYERQAAEQLALLTLALSRRQRPRRP